MNLFWKEKNKHMQYSRLKSRATPTFSTYADRQKMSENVGKCWKMSENVGKCQNLYIECFMLKITHAFLIILQTSPPHPQATSQSHNDNYLENQGSNYA